MRQRMVMVGLVLALACLPVAAQEQVDQDEIRRLGNFVHETQLHIGPQAGEGDLFLEAMGPPASDADKWFISVISIRNCAGCQQLKQAWQTDPWLLALANPKHPQQSWSHYHLYNGEDRSQMWRFAKLKISAYPTIVVQPPLSGKYGDGGTVVYQGMYGGDPKALAQEITTAIRQYVETRQQPGPTPVIPSQPPQSDELTPPFTPAPQDDAPALPTLPDGAPVKVPPDLPGPPTPVSTPPQPQSYPPSSPTGTEAVIITDSEHEVDEVTQQQMAVVVDGLKRHRGRNLRVRQLDWQEAQHRFPLRSDELPAILVQCEGRLVDKLTRLLFPCLRPKPPSVWEIAVSWLWSSLSAGLNVLLILVIVGYIAWRLMKRWMPFGKQPQPSPTPATPPSSDVKPAN